MRLFEPQSRVKSCGSLSRRVEYIYHFRFDENTFENKLICLTQFLSGETKAPETTLTEKQLAAKLKREAAKKKREEEQKARKAEQDARKEIQKQNKSRFSICTKVGQPMAVAYKQAMELLEKGRNKGLQAEEAFTEVAQEAKVVGA